MDLDASKLTPWIKVLALRLALEKSSWVMWNDADVIMRDMQWDLKAFINKHMPQGVHFLTADDMVWASQ